MTWRERLVKFLKAMREELLRVREWSETDIGLCFLARKVYRERYLNRLVTESDTPDSDLEPDHIIQYLHKRYEIRGHAWAEFGRQSRLAFLDQAIADLEAEIKEGL